MDGQWYVFIIDENDLLIGHPEPGRLGLDLKGWVGTDANGYELGPEMLSATEDGKWVSYVHSNPESGGGIELKNAWVKRHYGLLFGSGWYIEADAFTRMLVSVAVDKFRELGLARGPWPTSPVREAPWRAWKRPSPTTTTPTRPAGTGSPSSETRTGRLWGTRTRR